MSSHRRKSEETREEIRNKGGKSEKRGGEFEKNEMMES